jgi:GDPmannose 4,6-dehydratase
MPRSALITGISGQDGIYLSRLLVEKGYAVHGILRRPEAAEAEGLKPLRDRITYHVGDLTDGASLRKALEIARPDEVYNLAAQSSVAASFQDPVATAEITAVGAARILEGVRQICPKARFFQAGSSEMYGGVREEPQSEATRFRPRSPYGAAKVHAHWLTINYRESFGLFAANGILFSHESPMRSAEFLARKTASAVARIKFGLQSELRLGNLDVYRDWGFAGDYVRAMWLIMQHHQSDDFVIATGVKRTTREFVSTAFDVVGLKYEDYVVIDPAFFRPCEPVTLCGDASKARRELGWQPQTSFEELIRIMVEAELERHAPKTGSAPRRHSPVSSTSSPKV